MFFYFMNLKSNPNEVGKLQVCFIRNKLWKLFEIEPFDYVLQLENKIFNSLGTLGAPQLLFSI